MANRKTLVRVLAEGGPLSAVIAALLLALALLGSAGPALAQFFPFGRSAPPPPGPPSDFPFFDPFRPNRPRPTGPAADSSRAPAPKKSDTVPERSVLVLGDAMADWLAYGLEDAFSETPEIGIVRKHKTISGLIKYQPKGDPADWAAAAKTILAAEKADVIVVMLGLSDRSEIREPVAEKKSDKPAPKKDAKEKDAKPGKPDVAAAKLDSKPAAGATPEAGEAKDSKPSIKPADSKPVDDEAGPAEADDETPSIVAPERAAASSKGSHEFRSEKWVELYNKKIEELIGVLKAKGVPVLWVGLPAVRGPRATSDMLFLDALYRDGAGKAGITYVDVWDGFVDESGRFLNQGPDFEGQIRRLRSADGVYFTKAGARKLAHYAEREIRRVMASRAIPVALPTDPGTPDTTVRPGAPAARPIAGPTVPLVAATVGSDELLGGAGTRPASVDALAARTLVKGEVAAAPAGRADDFAWPRRALGAGEVPLSAKELEDAEPPAVAARPRPVAAPVDAAGRPRPPAGTVTGIEPRPRGDAPRPPGAVGRPSGGGFFSIFR